MSSSRALRSLLVAVAVISTASIAAKPSKKKLAAEAAKLQTIASDAAIVAAVERQNARELPLKAVRLLDTRWFVGREGSLVRKTISGPCAERLREFLAANPAHGEAFVLDTQGAVVCANARTLNYWFGEQPRWQEASAGRIYGDNEGLVSVPLKSGDKTIGVLTSRLVP